MNKIQISQAKFYSIKSKLDGIIMWRKIEDDLIEIVAMKKFKRYVNIVINS